MKTNINKALLSVKTALLGSVVPELRAVTVNLLEKKDTFFIRFYHDGEISEEIHEIFECAITEAFEYALHLDSKIIQLNAPAQIPLEGAIAYLRKEQNIPEKIKKIKDSFQLPYKEPKYFFGNLNRAMQNALIGQITPNIREVSIEYEDKHIFVIFYFEGEIKQEDHQNMKEIMGLFCLSFPKYYIHLRYFRIDSSPNLPPHQIVIYERYDKECLNSPLNAPFQIPGK